MRTITIRTEVMIILQVTYDKMEWTEKILKAGAKDLLLRKSTLRTAP
ncbi:hypothetical protein [Chryseolinea sp. H1M3-3]|nr:hypothetical protein [Chryseolinea sp. H1M3-3]